MLRYILTLTLALVCAGSGARTRKVVELEILHTSDLHGNLFRHDFATGTPSEGGLARVHTLVEQERRTYADRLLLFDGGDLLQGSPSTYYYNFIDTTSTHLAARMLHYMGYDAAAMGNHDIETGRSVFERYAADARYEVLGANIVDASTGEPFFKPYTVFERGGVKVAVLGLITPAVPAWLPEDLWRGLRFDDMEASARRWMRVIRERERPDAVIGLFHAGQNAHTLSGIYRENASVEVAERVPGFDAILIGHDHRSACQRLEGPDGKPVWMLDPASGGDFVGRLRMTFEVEGGKVKPLGTEAELVDMDKYAPSPEWERRFADDFRRVARFVDEEIGHLDTAISTRPAYFGPSPLIDLIHSAQLAISGAEISLAAPLTFDATIPAGKVTVGDLFRLYRYENQLCTMRLTGREVKATLEMSYGLWTNRMLTPHDPLLLFAEAGGNGGKRLRNQSFNFDSAAGIRYTVDVTRPAGDRVRIACMADGSPFDPDRTYLVALNSYRGNGGGELLTRGAGIAPDELKRRIVCTTDRDLRYYLMEYIKRKRTIDLRPESHWKFVPEAWTAPAARRDYRALFGEGN